MIPACPICDGADIGISGPYRASHVCFTGLKRAHCNSCGIDFASPMPDKNDLEKFNNSYFDSAHGGKPHDQVSKAFFSGIARLRMAQIENYLMKYGISVCSMFEWGPGEGYFAHHWLEKYPETVYQVIETDVSCHNRLREIGVDILDNIPTQENTGKYDLVVMSHVLEHVTQPLKFLKDSVHNLYSGGAIFIEVPCRDWEHKKIDEPHLLFFDKNPMHQLLVSSGFQDIQLTYHGQTIRQLRNASMVRNLWIILRSKLIALGLISPFSRMRNGMEPLKQPIERAAIAPYKAHCESSVPAWWLRVLARKI